MSFEQIPNEIFPTIFDHLPIIDFAAVLSVSKTWNLVLNNYIRKHKNDDWNRICISDESDRYILTHSHHDGWWSIALSKEKREEEGIEKDIKPMVISLRLCIPHHIKSSKELNDLPTWWLENVRAFNLDPYISVVRILTDTWIYNITMLRLCIPHHIKSSKELNDLPTWWLENVRAFNLDPYNETIDVPLLTSRMPKLKNLRIIRGRESAEININPIIMNMRQIERLIIDNTAAKTVCNLHQLIDMIIKKTNNSKDGLSELEFFGKMHNVTVEDILKLFEKAHFRPYFTLYFTDLKGSEALLEEWIKNNTTDYVHEMNHSLGLMDRTFTYRKTFFIVRIVSFSGCFLGFLSDNESLFSCFEKMRD